MVANQDPFWLDELHTAWVTGGSLPDVWSRAAIGNQSPFYFWLVWPIVQFFGSESIRWLSLVAGMGLMLLSAGLTWKWTRSFLASLVVVWLIAIDPTFIFYSTEARPYALLELLGLIQACLFWRLLTSVEAEQKRSQFGLAVILALVSAAIFYTHYTGVWLFVAEIVFITVYMLVCKRHGASHRQVLKLTLLTALLTICICLPAVWNLIDVFDRRGNWSPVVSRKKLINDLSEPWLKQIAIPFLLVLIVCILEWLFKVRSIGFSRNQAIDSAEAGTTNKLTKVSFLILWCVVPVACVLGLDYFEIAPLALYRYTLIGAVAVPLFAAACVHLPHSRIGQLLVGSLIIIVSLFQNLEPEKQKFTPLIEHLIKNRTPPGMRSEDWSEPIATINAVTEKQNHPVFLFANLIEDVDALTNNDEAFQEYLRFPLNGVEVLDTNHRTVIAVPTWSENHFREEDIRLMKEQGGVWLVIRARKKHTDYISDQLLRQFSNDKNMRWQKSSFGSSIHLFSAEWR